MHTVQEITGLCVCVVLLTVAVAVFGNYQRTTEDKLSFMEDKNSSTRMTSDYVEKQSNEDKLLLALSTMQVDKEASSIITFVQITNGDKLEIGTLDLPVTEPINIQLQTIQSKITDYITNGLMLNDICCYIEQARVTLEISFK